MLWRYNLTIGIVLIWVSVIAIPYGTYLQTLSPNFREYEQNVVTEILSQSPDKDLAPGIGIGLALSSAWPFVAAFCAAIGLLFCFGVLVLRSIAGWNRNLALVASGVFLCGCFAGFLLGIDQAYDNLRWGFLVLSAGYFSAAVGLFLGALGVMGFCLHRGCDRVGLRG